MHKNLWKYNILDPKTFITVIDIMCKVQIMIVEETKIHYTQKASHLINNFIEDAAQQI